MGLINGLFGIFRKKIGPLVGRRVRGRNVVSVRGVRKRGVLSQLQLQHQARFKIVVGFLSQISALIKIGFTMKYKTRFNLAMHCNFGRIVKGAYPDYYIDYAEVVFSVGRLQGPNSPSVEIEDGAVVFGWLPDRENEYNRRTDLACFLAYDAQHEMPICAIKAVSREALGYRMDLPAGFSSDALHCYMSMVSLDGRETSRSVYIGCLTI